MSEFKAERMKLLAEPLKIQMSQADMRAAVKLWLERHLLYRTGTITPVVVAQVVSVTVPDGKEPPSFGVVFDA